jgi:excisionase family DNA binding protein
VDTLIRAEPHQDDQGDRLNGHGDHQPAQPSDHELTHGLTIDQAAARLGLSVTTVRRRIRQKQLGATLINGDHGPEYRVHLEPGQPTALIGEGDRPRDQAEHASLSSDQGSVARLVALVDKLTTENARLQDERAELFGRLGFYQAELGHARQTIKALQAPKEPIAAPPPAGAIFRPLPEEPEPRRRPWWKLWG